MEKFNQVPVEDSTKIIFENETMVGGYKVLYQKWVWDGIKAESVIFLDEDVDNISDKEIKEMVKDSPLINVGSSITLKRSESGFTFVNFNFEVE